VNDHSIVRRFARKSESNFYFTRANRSDFRVKLLRRDFGTATSNDFIIIFFLTSFFNDSIHQLVAANDRCTFSMKNGRENRTNGNQEKGKEEDQEALRGFSLK